MSHFLARIQRALYKFIYKLFAGPALKHNRRFWPYYQIERGSHAELLKVSYKHQLIADNTVHLPSSTQPVMLIATGPSIHQLDPSVLNNPYIDYMGVNGAISLSQINFKYYVIIDHNFVMNRFDLVEQVIQHDLILFTTPRCLDLILRKINPDQFVAQIRIIESITHERIEPIMQPAKTINRLTPTHHDHYIYHNRHGISLNIFNGVFDYYTVAYVALQVIHALHYQKVYIAGLDMNNLSKPRFYETENDKQPTWLDLNLDEVLAAFDSIGYLLKARNVQVYNLSLESRVTAFEKIDSKHINW